MTDIDHITEAIKTLDIVAQLNYFAKQYKDEIVFSTSFGLEDQVITHLIFSNQIPIKVFTLDTGRMFPETYEVLDNTERKYNRKIDTYFPEQSQVESLVNQKGYFSFYESVENRKECCKVRKVVPLDRALANNACWITGIRAEQSANRLEMKQLEWDEGHQLIKFHPLLNWSLEEVEKFIHDNFIPYNLLHDKGFPSIGCQPCTRAVEEGEDIRAGRWWWEQSSGKECGLHSVNK